MSAEGYSNRVLIGNWFEDRVQEDYLKTVESRQLAAPGETVVPNKVIMDFGCVRSTDPLAVRVRIKFPGALGDRG